MFDMNQCKAGDKLVCRDGTIAIYINKQNHEIYPHVVRIEDPEGKWSMSTTDLGNRYEEHESSNDIIGFYKEEPKMIERDKEYDLKVTGEQLAWIWYLIGSINGGFSSNAALYDKVDNMFKNHKVNTLSTCSSWMGNVYEHRNEFNRWFDKLFTKPETPEQAKQRELREQYEATKKQLEELGKQLGIE